MKKLLAAMFVALLMVGCGKSSTHHHDLASTVARLYEEYPDLVPPGVPDGVPDGLQTIRHENGQIQSEITYKGGMKDGLSTMWYENGQKASEGNWTPTPTSEEWRRSRREYKWEDGMRDGFWTGWYKNGQKSSEGSWKDGKRDGFWTEWLEYEEKVEGLKRKEGNWRDGKMWSGVLFRYNEDGTEAGRWTFKDGEIVR